MNEYQTVTTVNAMIQAMAIRFGLEQAGIPTRVSNSTAAYSVLVPAALLLSAEGLLFPLGRAMDNRTSRS